MHRIPCSLEHRKADGGVQTRLEVLWRNYDVGRELPEGGVSFILDREVDSVATEDERRSFGSSPVFCTFGWFEERLARCKSVRNPGDPVTCMMSV